MPPVITAILLVVMLLWVGQAWFMVYKVRKFAMRADKPHHSQQNKFWPRAWVIVPFRGVDEDLEANVRGMFEQQYPSFHLLLVVDSSDDPSHAVLSKVKGEYPQQPCDILVAGPAGANEGQKVRNQLHAIRHIESLGGSAKRDDVWVFADSDAVPDPTWLANLVKPLSKERKTGVTTGYRWLVPEQPATMWSHLASIMNSSVACMLGKDEHNHAWGGSMAVRADVAEQGNLAGLLEGALCDDYQFTRMCRHMDLRVYYVPSCLVPSRVNFTAASLVNFAHRQYLLTRVYAPRLYVTALVLLTLYPLGVLAACVSVGAGVVMNDITLLIAGSGAMVMVFIANQWRASLRQRAAGRSFSDEILADLRRTFLIERWTTPVWMTLHALLAWRAAFGRVMNWRGIRYRLYGPQRVERLD